MFKKNKDISKIIREKKFNKELTAGYDALEVDMFLDDVILYINEIEEENNLLKQQNIQKDEKMKKMKSDLETIYRSYECAKSELNKLIEDGYNNQKVIKEISFMRDEIESLKTEKKKYE